MIPALAQLQGVAGTGLAVMNIDVLPSARLHGARDIEDRFNIIIAAIRKKGIRGIRLHRGVDHGIEQNSGQCQHGQKRQAEYDPALARE